MTMSIASQIFALFFAVLYGALFTISDRWRPFFIRHDSREGWYRAAMATGCLGVCPVLYFVFAFEIMLGVAGSTWVQLVIAVYAVAPLVAFYFVWLWIILRDPKKAYSPSEQGIEPVKSSLDWVGGNGVSAAGVVALLGIFLVGPILGLAAVHFCGGQHN